MKLDILGVCGTFMGGVALLAQALGHRVTGADRGIYPPMSTMLDEAGIDTRDGFDPADLDPTVDRFLIGNALSRGNPAVEHILDHGHGYTSGPQWLAESVLHDRWVLAVSGTHGKTTTASMLAWILDFAGLEPGFLIGGIPGNFGHSARLGGSPFFVIEADEYDTAFFDKRAKFVHFRPRTLVINNIEYDHADIFPDLAAIELQFHHLVRTVPGGGLILANGDDATVVSTLARGCWSGVTTFGTGAACDWRVLGDAGQWQVSTGEPLQSPLAGEHNARNALAALLAARHVGVPLTTGLAALRAFAGVKRRLEVRGEVAGVRVVDDFAHHPTAILATLGALRDSTPGRLIAVLEPRSNTMRLGRHGRHLRESLASADAVFALQPPGLDWDLRAALGPGAAVESDVAALADATVSACRPGDTIVVMSNGGFGGIHQKLLEGLGQRRETSP